MFEVAVELLRQADEKGHQAIPSHPRVTSPADSMEYSVGPEDGSRGGGRTAGRHVPPPASLAGTAGPDPALSRLLRSREPR